MPGLSRTGSSRALALKVFTIVVFLSITNKVIMKKLLSLSTALLSLLFARAQNCPVISVESYSYEAAAGDTITFVAGTKGVEAHVTYNWAISAGTIISGQGTAKILVNTEGLAGMYVTASVVLGGLPRTCVSSASFSVEVVSPAQLVVSGTFTNGQELKNAVQKFIAASGITDPANAGTGFIYLYKGATTSESALKIFKDAIISAFTHNKVLPHQYKIADGGKRKLAFYEMYLLQPRGKEPKPSR
jgi:hypothetical protein